MYLKHYLYNIRPQVITFKKIHMVCKTTIYLTMNYIFGLSNYVFFSHYMYLFPLLVIVTNNWLYHGQ